ncbi:hypothetical protein ILYODFUR_034961 [Ilyodon furcidens]|uniref:Uncharacterized protein n=1 Tax=Ilyodon furcidens TaxID=33524 RepID=A0ABV0VJN2_9TELE
MSHLPSVLSAILDFSCEPGRTFNSFTCINKVFKPLFGVRKCCLKEGLKPNQHDNINILILTSGHRFSLGIKPRV